MTRCSVLLSALAVSTGFGCTSIGATSGGESGGEYADPGDPRPQGDAGEPPDGAAGGTIDASSRVDVIGPWLSYECGPALRLTMADSLQPGTCSPWGDVNWAEILLEGSYEAGLHSGQSIEFDDSVVGTGGGSSYFCPSTWTSLNDCQYFAKGKVRLVTVTPGVSISGSYVMESGETGEFNASWCIADVICG